MYLSIAGHIAGPHGQPIHDRTLGLCQLGVTLSSLRVVLGLLSSGPRRSPGPVPDAFIRCELPVDGPGVQLRKGGCTLPAKFYTELDDRFRATVALKILC